jgi:hypothetical protein
MLFGALAWLLAAAGVQAQATDLIISEYVEGSSNNKYIELYNGTAGSINLVDYELQLFVNGAGSPSYTLALSGTLAAGGTIVYGNSTGTIYTEDVSNNSLCFFNGDDALALYKVSTASYVDIFGQYNCDPGTEWSSGSYSTQNRTLVRKANICAGITANPVGGCIFPTLSTEWDLFNQDDASHLGNHTMTCGPTVNFDAATSAFLENSGAVTVDMTISPATTSAETITITIGGGSTASYGAGNDYTTAPAGPSTITVNVPSGSTTASFTVNLVNDALSEGDETIDFSMTGTSGGLSIGSAAGHVLTITDDDVTPTIEFTTLTVNALESAGAQTFTLSLTMPHPAASATIQITNGPGAAYGTDYSTNPSGAGSTITVSFLSTDASVSFTADPMSDGLPESTEQVTFTILSVSDPSFVIGTNTDASLLISDIDSPPTVLAPGDLAIVGVNANDNACGADNDFISFFSFKEITYNTQLIVTDNGYERCNPAQWGNTEGTMRLTRTGTAIPAGQVVTFQVNNSGTNVTGVAPDAGWSCTSIGITGTRIALNNGGEQVFFMQGGTWTPGVSSGHNSTFTGTVLYGFSTNPGFPWQASCSTNPSQRSNLPPGVECFSMAPTSATDYSKYSGPNSAATQRDWIIRIDDPTNWTTYPNCTQYAASGYDWLSAPVLPILPGGMTAGLWRGAVNTDWFECKNWDDARVPTASTPVAINQSALDDCQVGLATGLNPGGTAVCAQLDITSTNAVSPSLSIEDNSSLQVGGPFTIQRTAGTGNLVASLQDGARLTATDLWLQSVNTGLSEAVLQIDQDDSQAHLSGNLTIAGGGLLDMNGGNDDSLFVAGHFNNMAGEARFDDAGSTVVFNGSTDQSFTGVSPEEYFDNLWVDKTGGNLVLEAPIRLRNLLLFGQGLVVDTLPGTLVTLDPLATATGMSDASYVQGPVRKFGGNDFDYPVGDSGYYRPCALLNNTATSGESFTARYWPLNPDAAPTLLVQPTPLDHISHCEYWTINQSDGSPHARVRLTWNTPASCQTTPFNINDLRVVRWSGTNWDDRGNFNPSGTSVSGDVSSAAVETAFSPWTLGSITSNNPLPVELLRFTAVPNGPQVDLAWSTASEHNSAFFTVERSADAAHFQPVLELAAAGNSQQELHYAASDVRPLAGLSYYRLRQTDLDGSSSLSSTVPVFFGGNDHGLAVLYTADLPLLAHQLPPGSHLDLLDAAGRPIGSMTVDREGPQPIPMEGRARGLYLLRVKDGTPRAVRFAW